MYLEEPSHLTAVSVKRAKIGHKYIIYVYMHTLHIIYYVLLYTNVRGLFSRIISNATWNNDGRGGRPETKEKLKT